MTDSHFTQALQHVLRHEGGLVDHPADPGGRTNRGITQRKLNEVRAAAAWLNLPATVDELTEDQVATIYRREYWSRLSCDELPASIALAAFDAGVNAGIGRSAKWLQQAAGVKADGIIGAQTIAAIKAAPRVSLLNEFNARRAWHYMLLDSLDDTFGLGWARRLMDTHTAALAAA